MINIEIKTLPFTQDDIKGVILSKVKYLFLLNCNLEIHRDVRLRLYNIVRKMYRRKKDGRSKSC